jgi:hypothetical protein
MHEPMMNCMHDVNQRQQTDQKMAVQHVRMPKARISSSQNPVGAEFATEGAHVGHAGKAHLSGSIKNIAQRKFCQGGALQILHFSVCKQA